MQKHLYNRKLHIISYGIRPQPNEISGMAIELTGSAGEGEEGGGDSFDQLY